MKPKISNARKTTIPQAKVFWANVDYLKAVYDVTDATLASALNRSRTTLYKFRANPEMTEMRDIYNAAFYFEVDAAQLLVPMKTSTVKPLREEE